MQVEFSITIDTDAFINYTGVKINYSDRSIPEQGIWLNSNPLLFEELVIPQHIICFNQNNYKAFFKTPNADYPFDIFAATPSDSGLPNTSN